MVRLPRRCTRSWSPGRPLLHPDGTRVFEAFAAEATRLAAVSAAELRKSVSNQWCRKAKPSPPTADSIPPRWRDGRDARTSSTLEKK